MTDHLDATFGHGVADLLLMHHIRPSNQLLIFGQPSFDRLVSKNVTENYYISLRK